MSATTPVTIDSMVARWMSAERPLFKGSLIDDDGCYCAQGDVLHCAGYTDAQLRALDQAKADLATAQLLGISRAHAVLLRIVNDRADGAPQVVLTHPEQVLGDQAERILAFWWHLDAMTAVQWDAAQAAAWDAARDGAWDAARDAARDAAGAAARDGAWDAARAAAWDAARAAAGAAARDAVGDAARAAAWATAEIMGAVILQRDARQPFFLPIFGIASWDALAALPTGTGAAR